MSSYRTDHSRARGLGSAKHGASHWIGERVTSIALAPLSLWAIYVGMYLARASYADAIAWVANPLNGVLTCLLLLVSFVHMHAGMRVIVEDYIHKTFSKVALLVLNLFVCVLAGGLGVFAVLKVAFLGGAY